MTGASVITTAQNKPAYEMMVDGVKVIVQPSGNEIVEIQTIVKGGVQNYPAGKDGIESLAFSALTECGTANDDKNSFKNKLDKVSAQIYGYSGMDYAAFNLNCIKDDLDAVWSLYVDALTTPAFDAKEFERIRQDAINSLKMQASNPDYAISKYARQTAFAGKNYAKTPEGTEASVARLTVAETKAYFKNLLTRSRMVVVVVGEIEKEELEQKIKKLLAPIPHGTLFRLKKDSFLPSENSFHSAKKDFATNYIQAVSAAPAPGTPDYNAFVLAMRIFSDRQFLDVRTKHGLSYAPYSYFDGGLSPTANIFVSTTEPNKYVSVINDLVSRTRKEGFTEEEVKNMKNTYITDFYYRLETNGAQASSLAANEVLHNNWRRSLTINEDMKNLGREDLNRAFNKYVNRFVWVYQGDPQKVNAVLYTGKKPGTTPASKLGTQKKN
jgi:predicted Zn-dependent peptidase